MVFNGFHSLSGGGDPKNDTTRLGRKQHLMSSSPSSVFLGGVETRFRIQVDSFRAGNPCHHQATLAFKLLKERLTWCCSQKYFYIKWLKQ